MFSKIYPLSESAITIEFGCEINAEIYQQIANLNVSISENPFIGFIETVPAYTTLTVYYKPEFILTQDNNPYFFVKNYIEKLIDKLPIGLKQKEKSIAIPVCYDEEFGYDLEFVAETNGISKETVIQLHTENQYKVYMMGFLPGFSYMGEVDNAIATPRKSTPRALIEEGAVGIAGKQTGIYPLPSPGGWQIIGRTPFCLFDTQKADPFLFKSGDEVTFYPISKQMYFEIKDQQTKISIVTKELNLPDIIVLKPGIFSTIQDNGRFGFRAFGVPSSGAMDIESHTIANALVGNTIDAATIECTMGGLQLQFKKNTKIAITGGGSALLNNQKINFYEPQIINTDDILAIQFNNQGIRTYISVLGGFATNNGMNSNSTSPMIGIGTILKKEMGLLLENKMRKSNTKPSGFTIPTFDTHKNIRIIKGPETDWMTPESVQKLHSQNFSVSNRCDRMGYHLHGEPLELEQPKELLSTAVTKGTIQLTSSGQLIVLMSDCQTTGGYPRIGQIAAVDLHIIAQLKPNETINFITISFTQAQDLYLLNQKTINGYFC